MREKTLGLGSFSLAVLYTAYPTSLYHATAVMVREYFWSWLETL